jgi:serine/threonine protein kinase/Flp pilus assembly protein TadD
MNITTGTQLGHYEIRSKIGEGGMGEVYLALDRELDRTVAIKILPQALASNQQRLLRFIQEAKAASALNHPHILTIHEIGTTGATRFIATEFIEGETLRQRMTEGLKLAEILDIVSQSASALAAAHAAGIIHRDIKPENIMVRRDGYIKVLDFGLAKLTEPSITDTEAPTRPMINTREGTVMGTPNYMSPEQAQGTKVDARTDLWSLGTVIYEMVTGQLPFAGKTPTETISLILQKEPAPLTRYLNEVPAELERIVAKSLTKNREERYQTAKDLLIDLRNLKRKLEVDAEIDRTVPSEFRTAGSTSGGPGTPVTASGAAAVTAQARAAPGASSAEYILSGIKQHKLAVAIAVIAVALGALGLFAYLHARNTEVAIESIAVLPFQNRSTETDTEYLSEGLAESLIYRLSQLPNLRVSPTSSVFRYYGKEIDPIKVGQELGVNAVLSGRIVQHGDNLTISAELVDVRYNKLVWGEQYDRKMSDLLAMQREIAREIVDKLKLKVSGEEKGLAKHYTENNEAYQLYLKGRFYWNKRTGEALKKSIEFFNQAIEKDPSFALAYAGLADCYVVRLNPLPPREKMLKAKAAAMRALVLDETLAEAHTSLGRVLATYDWDWTSAEKEYKRALELNPRYAIAHQWYGGWLQVMGHRNEAIAERKLAQELDPLSPIVNFELGLAFYYARDYDQAIEQFQKTLELDQNFPPAHYLLPAAYEQKGMYSEAIAEFKKAIPLTGGSEWSFTRGALGHIYAVVGKKSEARAVLDELKQMSQQEYVPADSIALVYAGLGEKDQAFAWLEKAYGERSFGMAYLKVEPRWDSLRSDPRFADLVRRVGLPQ